MIYVFTGPTITPEAARSVLDAVYLPPVSQGDVLRATRDRPAAIGIIDGYFHRVPAVWHKEILWAMSEGIHVLGAASMGALRAAELEPFGMVGVGEVFAAYRDGRLDDDDEVALIHGPAESGYLPCSEPMVDIRATLARAVEEGVIGAEGGQRLTEIAKSLHYPQRLYPRILEQAAADGLDATSLEHLRQWLPDGRVKQKRLDAVALLEKLAADPAAWSEPKRVRYTFQRTEIWEEAVRMCGRQPVQATVESGLSELLFDELRLLGRDVFLDRRNGALLRSLAQEEVRRQGLTISGDALQETLDVFRRRRCFQTREEVEAWIGDQGLDHESFQRLMAEESCLSLVHRMFRPEADRQLESELRIRELFGRLAERAQEKLHFLATRTTDLEATGLSEGELLAWYFEERLGDTVPKNLESYVADLGLLGRDVFVQVLVREYLFSRSTTGG